MNQEQKKCLDPLDIERFVYSDPDRIPNWMAQHVKGCKRCKVAVEEAWELEKKFQGTVYHQTLPRILGETGKTRTQTSLWLQRFAWGTSVAAAVALAVVLFPSEQVEDTSSSVHKQEQIQPADDPDESADKTHAGTNRQAKETSSSVHKQEQIQAEPDESTHKAYLGTKGGPSLTIVVKRGSEQFEYTPQTPLQPNDMLRVVPHAPGFRYVMLVNRDASGGLSVVYPYGSRTSKALPSQGGPLEGSLVLDDALGIETLYAVYGKAPFDIEQVKPVLKNQQGASGAVWTDKLPMQDQTLAVFAVSYTKEADMP